jgi:hypothetical protein
MHSKLNGVEPFARYSEQYLVQQPVYHKDKIERLFLVPYSDHSTSKLALLHYILVSLAKLDCVILCSDKRNGCLCGVAKTPHHIIDAT